ncbi:hypothetical protein EIP91_010545 [Steccherinum ochraceum]|uniref:Uncharacterized protein n=1 Tax=Steccherinum ochraceum TaxID=92696 RepID=A0A4R0R8D1_9APHY|nr:hypothetical protein EIP91_010545 [Steccherinum ochraceum]
MTRRRSAASKAKKAKAASSSPSTSTAHSSSSSPKPFSADVFYHIFKFFDNSNIDDLFFLWTTCRQVSKDVNSAVEHIFVTSCLKQTSLIMEDEYHFGPNYTEVILRPEFTFVELDPTDPSRAIFRIPIPSHSVPTAADKQRMSKHLKDTFDVFESPNPVHMPQIMVRVLYTANDTYVPGFKPNWEKLEVSVDWRGMYSERFKEEKEHKRWLTENIDQISDLALSMALDTARQIKSKDPVAFFHAMTKMQQMKTDFRTKAYKTLRKERIRRNVCKYDGAEDYNCSDEEGEEKLKTVRQWVGEKYAVQEVGDKFALWRELQT